MLPCATSICPSGTTPAHNVIIHDGLGDQQVTPLGAQFEARTIGAKNLQAVNREIWGIDDAMSGFSGNGYVEFAFPGLPPDPITNVPPDSSYPDPHDALRQLDSAQDMVDQFFKTGTIVQTCANGAGPCSAPMNWSNIPLLTPATEIDAGEAPDADAGDAGVGDSSVGDSSVEATTDAGTTGDATSD
jgi:hypothetical protein